MVVLPDHLDVRCPPAGFEWAAFAATLLAQMFFQRTRADGPCSIMLAGGRSAELVYRYWGAHPELFADGLAATKFLFGDERCVPPDHAESNFGMAERTWFGRGGEAGKICVVRMEGESLDREAAARAYEKILPETIDFLLLGMGEDGHIASLFPNENALWERGQKVVPVLAPKIPAERLTITPAAIDLAKTVILMVVGAEKGRTLARAFDDLTDIAALPVRLVLPRAVLLLDADATKVFRSA